MKTSEQIKAFLDLIREVSRESVLSFESGGVTMETRSYYRLITDMREAARLALHTGEDRALVCELCGLKLTQCANEFEKLLQKLVDLEDDGK